VTNIRCCLVVSVLVTTLCLAGCGSGTGGSGGGGGPTLALGPLQIEVAAGGSPQTLTLPSPGTSRIAFTAFHGATITRLEEIGYGKLVVRGFDGHDSELYLMNSDGTEVQQLTNNDVDDWHPTWSPDARKIAFRSFDGNDYEIYSMSADGSGVTQLTFDNEDCHDPWWSPDGRQIVFGADDPAEGDEEVYVMNANGSGLTQLTDNSVNDGSAAWSPDGRTFVYQSGNELWLMNTDGSDKHVLAIGFVNPFHPAWSPDGARIAFYARDGGDYEMYMIQADGSGLTALTNNSVNDRHPSWRPDGRQIAFERWDGTDYEIYLMDPDGSRMTPVTRNSVDDAQAEWRPTPSAVRTLIGPSGSDGGSRPPFGSARPLAIVGLTADGLASATTIGLAQRNWSTLQVEALQSIGTDLAGVRIGGNNIRQVIEDMGRGMPARVWTVSGSPTTGAALIFLSGETGRVTSVLAVGESTADLRTQRTGERIAVRGAFIEAYSARDPARDLIPAVAREIVLDAHTGEVTTVR
jgi:TolB protein